MRDSEPRQTSKLPVSSLRPIYSEVPKPQILLISLSARSQVSFDNKYDPLIERFSPRSKLKHAKTAAEALRYLEEDSPHAVVIADQGLTDTKNKKVLDKLVEYVQGGGLAIAALFFTTLTSPKAFDNFFEAFGLPWTQGYYDDKLEFQFNDLSIEHLDLQNLKLAPGPYEMKVKHVKGALPNEKMLIPMSGAMTQSILAPAHVDETQAAMVGANVGEGRLIYIGDFDAEDYFDDFVLSLCELE